ncbi:MAG: ABC transporter ATP-binding protein [Pseudomonadota bacterium]
MGQTPLLSVKDLTVAFGSRARPKVVVDGVSFDVHDGETIALVGESGSGKTLTGKAILGLLPRRAWISGGNARYRDESGNRVDMLGQSKGQMRHLRGAAVSMIFQEPMSAFSPLHTVGRQIREVLDVHRLPGNARQRAIEMLAEVGCPDAERAYNAYPFELSGGLRQRAMIALAMVGNPKLVIADEPTTALDVTTQAVVLDLLNRLQRDHGLAVIMITHDLGVVANTADRVVVLQRGRVVERGPAEAVMRRPGHAYTRRLIAAAPHVPNQVAHYAKPSTDRVLTAEDLNKTYPGRFRSFGRPGPPIRAVAGLSLALERGQTVAVVGESGSGKSTVARLILRAERPDPGGSIYFCGRDGEGVDIAGLQGEALKSFRRRAQMVFQDPYAALSPRLSVQDILTEPLLVHNIGSVAERRNRAAELMKKVGLSPDHLARFPHAFSGGQRQRIAIARALALSPELLVCDEPTSALDVSVQAEVLELLAELKTELGLSYVFISHDLAVVAKLADRVLVMRRGRVVEEGSANCIFYDSRHPYTRALIAASPEPDMERKLDLKLVAEGAGEPDEWPEPFGYRGDAAPGLVEVAPGHLVRRAA